MVDRPSLSLRVRYWLAKRVKEAQRVSTLVGIGALMIAFSPLSGTPEREEWWRINGALLAVWAYGRWRFQQEGLRRKDPQTGQDLRKKNPTLRMSPEQSEQIRHYLEGSTGQ